MLDFESLNVPFTPFIVVVEFARLTVLGPRHVKYPLTSAMIPSQGDSESVLESVRESAPEELTAEEVHVPNIVPPEAQCTLRFCSVTRGCEHLSYEMYVMSAAAALQTRVVVKSTFRVIELRSAMILL